MSRRLSLAAALIAAAVLIPTAAASAAAKPTYYLSLGDSLSVGWHADGVAHRTNNGYADLLVKRYPGVKLKKLGCPGETSGSFITGKGNVQKTKGKPGDGKCGKKPQLDQAVAFLKAHKNQVKLVTLDIGANDIAGCIKGGSPDLNCITDGQDAIAKNVPKIAKALRKAGGSKPVYAGMNLYNPFAALSLSPSTAFIGNTSVALADGVNKGVAKAFKAQKFKLADVATAFHTDDKTPTTLPNGTATTTNVATICALTWMCAPAPQGPDIHTNATGYQTIADALAQILGVYSLPS